MKNKWTRGLARNWFYYKVPLEPRADARGKGTYPLRSEMTPLEYLTDAPDKCGTVGTLQTWYPYIQASSQDKEQDVHPSTAMCPIAPDPTFLLRWAPTLPYAQ
jgi:hypothetical protein